MLLIRFIDVLFCSPSCTYLLFLTSLLTLSFLFAFNQSCTNVNMWTHRILAFVKPDGLIIIRSESE